VAATPEDLMTEAARHGVDLAGALDRMDGNRRVYCRLLASFANDLSALPAQLDTLLQQGQQVDASRLMHTIKGLAATLGLKPLAQVAAAAETLLLGAEGPGRSAALADSVRAAAASAAQAVALLRDGLQDAPGAAAATGGMPDAEAAADPVAQAAGLRDAVRELAVLLRSADMRAIDVFEHLQQAHAVRLRMVLQTVLQPLDEAMAALDFERALVHCQALAEEVGT